MSISQIDKNSILTCLYTELAKCYFCIGRYMTDSKIVNMPPCDECQLQHPYAVGCDCE